jgi:hypothetical protein
MKYDAFEIPEKNIPAHLDIEKDIQSQKDGLFTFVLKIADGKISDYNVVIYTDARKYLKLKKVVIEELTISRNIELGNQGTAIRPNNSKY